MLTVLALAFPLLLLALPLLMERIERPLRSEATIDEVARRMPRGAPDELERLVSEGYAPAVERYWRRRRLAALLALRAERD
jgi:hypothetical protein